MAKMTEVGDETKLTTPPVSSQDLTVSSINTFIDNHRSLICEDCPFLLSTGVQLEAFLALPDGIHGKLFLKDGDLYIKDLSSAPHEETVCVIEQFLTSFAGNPLKPLGSARTAFGADSAHEPNSGYRNRYVRPIRSDPFGVAIPSVIVEVGYSESLQSLSTTALHYMRHQHVCMVLSIKLIARRGSVQEMLCIVHCKGSSSPDHLQRIISFGCELSNSTITEVNRVLRPKPGQFVGVGLGISFPYAPDDPTFVVSIPPSVIWAGVPVDAAAGDCDRELSCLIKLHRVLTELIDSGHVEMP